jgi:branched-chain amino acid transport system ATP-binding protein
MSLIPPEPLLHIDRIDVYHGSFQALWDLSLDIGRGEMVALIGANTAGKSTLLDTISGLLHPARGRIEFEGQEISRLEPHHIVDLGITQIPEGRRIFPEMSVLGNLLMGAHTPRARRNKNNNLQHVFELFPKLRDRKNQVAKTLSGGEQQMLAISRGLMSEPKLVMIDEMSLGLAPIVVNDLFKILNQIKQAGITILVVEQNVRKCIQEADRAYILETGKVVLCGECCELQEEEKVKKAYFGV